MRLWRAAQWQLQRPLELSDSTLAAPPCKIYVRGRRFVFAVEQRGAAVLPPEPLFFGSTLQANRALVEVHTRPTGLSQGLRPRTNLDALVGFLACTAAASACALALAASPRSPLLPPTAAILCWVLGGLWIATDRLVAVTESYDTRVTLSQLAAIYQVHDTLDMHHSRASATLGWLEDERAAGRLNRPSERALNELYAFIMSDAREQVRELGIDSYLRRIERDWAA